MKADKNKVTNTNAGASTEAATETAIEKLARLSEEQAVLRAQIKADSEKGGKALAADSAEIAAKYGMSIKEFHSAWARVNGLFANRGGKKNSKLTPEKRAEMIEVLKTGEKTTKAVAAQFGVSSALVSIEKRKAGLTASHA